MIQLHPYNLGSRSAMALKEWLTNNGVRAIVSHRVVSKRRRMFIGWGAKSFEFDTMGAPVMNHPTHTKLLSCKKRFFEHVDNGQMGAYLPQFTSDPSVPVGWNDTVVVRHSTTDSGGNGIELVETGNAIPKAPLYTKYQKKTHEYRLHLHRPLGGNDLTVAEIQRKVFVKSEENPEPEDWRIRNHTKGFIFQTEMEAPEEVIEASKKVMDCFPYLSFAALDVIYHKPTNLALVLEGNTAPGLEGSRLEIYGNFIKSEYERNF